MASAPHHAVSSDRLATCHLLVPPALGSLRTGREQDGPGPHPLHVSSATFTPPSRCGGRDLVVLICCGDRKTSGCWGLRGMRDLGLLAPQASRGLPQSESSASRPPPARQHWSRAIAGGRAAAVGASLAPIFSTAGPRVASGEASVPHPPWKGGMAVLRAKEWTVPASFRALLSPLPVRPPGTDTHPEGAPPQERASLCSRCSGLGVRGAPVPSTQHQTPGPPATWSPGSWPEIRKLVPGSVPQARGRQQRGSPSVKVTASSLGKFSRTIAAEWPAGY